MGAKEFQRTQSRSHTLTKMFQIRRIRWRTAITYTLVVASVMAGLYLFLSRQLGNNHVSSLEGQFVAQALAASTAPELLEALQSDQNALSRLLVDWSSLLGSRATVFDAEAVALADSHLDAQLLDTSHTLPEVRSALANGVGRSVRIDPVSEESVTFLAFPIMDGDQVVGALRWAYSHEQARHYDRTTQNLLLSSLMAVALIMIVVMLFQFERSAYAVRQLTTVADRITEGQLDARVISMSRGDVGQLTRSFNRMAGKLENQIRKRGREKDRLNTVLHVMGDGVIMVSRKGKIRLINPAAAQILQTSESKALKRSFVQVVRDHRIAEVWQRCKVSGEQEVSGIELSEQRYLRIVVTPYLRGTARGYLIMLQDLSRMKRLQTIRQDFVSNVSHDLRTPLAALRALVDTLRDGAMDDPPAARRFLDRMEGEVDSLTQLVEELLQLSRIESGRAPLHRTTQPAAKVIRYGAERLQPQAERMDIDLVISIEDSLPSVNVDANRVQQVVTNLVHNAIKFTPPGGSVWVSAVAVGDTVTVDVRDTGAGIPASDLPRIFERFYKTDRARSSAGTGLGLAIAKHVIQAHGGQIWAESVEGEGSTFYFTLPLNNDANGANGQILHDTVESSTNAPVNNEPVNNELLIDESTVDLSTTERSHRAH